MLFNIRLEQTAGKLRFIVKVCTKTGRYLRVIYVPDPVPDSIFVITAYDLTGKPLKAYKRRRRRKLK